MTSALDPGRVSRVGARPSPPGDSPTAEACTPPNFAPTPSPRPLTVREVVRVADEAPAAHLFGSLRRAVRLDDRAIARTWLRAPAGAP